MSKGSRGRQVLATLCLIAGSKGVRDDSSEVAIVGQYIIRRLLIAIPVLLGVATMVFVAIRLVPGDPAEVMAGEMATAGDVQLIRHQLGLDRPLPVQYLIYLRDLVTGDLGRSTSSQLPVVTEIGTRFPNTLWLTVAAMAVAAAIGLATGVLSATRHNSLLDNACMLLALLGVSVPVFWLGLMLIMLFSVRFPLFPAGGMGGAENLVLPAITLGAASTGIISRMTRSSLLDVVGQDFIRTAWAKGLSERVVILKHALKNALIPVITVVGLQMGTLLGGAVLTETVFSWPGLGRLTVESILARDYPMVQGSVLVLGASFVTINLIVDVLYAFVDPRIRFD